MTHRLNTRFAPAALLVLTAVFACGGDDGSESFKDVMDGATTVPPEAGRVDAGAPDAQPNAAEPLDAGDASADTGPGATSILEAGSDAGPAVADAGDSSVTDSGIADDAAASDGGDAATSMATIQERVSAACTVQCTNQLAACDMLGDAGSATGSGDAGAAEFDSCVSGCTAFVPMCPTRAEFWECTSAIPFACLGGVPLQDVGASGLCFGQFLASAACGLQ